MLTKDAFRTRDQVDEAMVTGQKIINEQVLVRSERVNFLARLYIPYTGEIAQNAYTPMVTYNGGERNMSSIYMSKHWQAQACVNVVLLVDSFPMCVYRRIHST